MKRTRPSKGSAGAKALGTASEFLRKNKKKKKWERRRGQPGGEDGKGGAGGTADSSTIKKKKIGSHRQHVNKTRPGKEKNPSNLKMLWGRTFGETMNIQFTQNKKGRCRPPSPGQLRKKTPRDK